VALAYTGESLTTTFVVTAGMFGGLALFGTSTHRSLDGFGQFLFMGLIGVVLASIVNIFWQNDGFQFVLSFIGVIVFAGLAAYDAQRLKAMALATSAGDAGSYAIAGALALYLDFINLFLFLLRFTGSRRD
jgi:FtsH-binding integral membrane protein